jgi:hypothetical protein
VSTLQAQAESIAAEASAAGLAITAEGGLSRHGSRRNWLLEAIKWKTLGVPIGFAAGLFFLVEKVRFHDPEKAP